MKSKKYILALDQGTTSSRSILFDRKGEICSLAQREFRQHYPRPGWVEHDPLEIWESQLATAREAIDKLGAQPEEIAAVGITNQRETTVVWDAATGAPVYNAIVWQCRRTADRVKLIWDAGKKDAVQDVTGLIADAYFSASKLEWILDNVPGARERAERGELRFGTVDSWLIWNLTGGAVHATDYTNASRTMLFDIHKLDWDRGLLDYFRIPRVMLPRVLPSGCVYGETQVLGGSIPIAGVAGDQQASLFGQCCFDPGDVKNTYGTGCFMLMNTGTEAVLSRQGLLTTTAAVCAGEKPQYALEGSVFIAGAAIQWLRDELGLVATAPESEQCCRAVEDTGGVYVVPAFSGLGAPYWEPYARGTVVGLTRGTSRNHFVRATVESLAYQSNDLLVAMKKASGLPLRALRVDGGASANDFLMQFQADLSAAAILRPASVETTALGAAYLAGLSVGFWPDRDALRANARAGREFLPALPEEQRIARLRGWGRAVRCAVAWAQEEPEEA
ncbi:MAG: glycerol kinase GlpK [Oscillospiraceae bacterium]|nr:glycerol kinase GlpK [Oscillospiraceae bacterium]